MTARPPEVDRLQSRTLLVLSGSQALGGLGLTIGIAVAAVLARDVSGSEALAGFMQTAQVAGTALASYLLAGLMGRRGRRPGMVLGYLNVEGLATIGSKIQQSGVAGLESFDPTKYQFGIYGIIIVLMMLFRPTGLIPERRHKIEMEQGVHDTPFYDVDHGGQP